MKIPFQLKWSKFFSISYNMGHIFLNAAHNFVGRRVEDEGGGGGGKEGLVGEFVRLFISGFAG